MFWLCHLWDNNVASCNNTFVCLSQSKILHSFQIWEIYVVCCSIDPSVIWSKRQIISISKGGGSIWYLVFVFCSLCMFELQSQQSSFSLHQLHIFPHLSLSHPKLSKNDKDAKSMVGTLLHVKIIALGCLVGSWKPSWMYLQRTTLPICDSELQHRIYSSAWVGWRANGHVGTET